MEDHRYLIKLRKAAGLSQKELAENLSLHPHTVSYNERGASPISDRKGTLGKYVGYFSEKFTKKFLDELWEMV